MRSAIRVRATVAVATNRESSDLRSLDVVPPELLVPPDLPIRGGSRTDAGVVLDRELTALAGMESHGRLLQARIARRVIESRAWRPLGFVRLADYSRERVGLSSRTLEDDAQTLRRLDALPLLAAGLQCGQLSWTALQIVLRVANPGNERMLLDRAAAMTTRELEGWVKELAHKASVNTRAGCDAGPGPPGCPAADPSANARAAATDGGDDPEVGWSIEVSRSGRRLWRAASELASRTAGSPLGSGQVIELVVAEAMGEPRHPDSAGWWRWIPPGELLEEGFRESIRARRERGEAMLRGFLAEVGVVDGFGWLDPVRREPGPAQLLDELAGGLDGCDALELDRRFRVLRRAMQRIDAQLAALLYIGINRRLFREIGFATARLYIESRLGICSRKAWSLVAIERASWRMDARFRTAWRDGELSHLAAALLIPVVDDVTAGKWIERAGQVTLRRLADEVAWSLARRDAGGGFTFPPADDQVLDDGAAGVDPAEVQMRAQGPELRRGMPACGGVRMRFSIPVSVAVLLETALVLHQRRAEMRWRTFERLLAMAILEWTRVPRHRDPVFERDGWRCTVPACSSRRNLHDHHVMFRSRGGKNGRDNRVTVCAAHHLHGIHAGLIRARGRAPHDIVWELPLMRLRGDCYLR